MINQQFLDTYLTFINSTYAEGLTEEQSIANCVLSMAGELLEWQEEDPGSSEELLEAGDVVYYLIKLCEVLGLDVPTLYTEIEAEPYMNAERIVAKLADITKKHLFWGRQRKYDRAAYLDLLNPLLASTLQVLLYEVTLEQIILANTAKLSSRKGIPNPFKEPMTND